MCSERFAFLSKLKLYLKEAKIEINIRIKGSIIEIKLEDFILQWTNTSLLRLLLLLTLFFTLYIKHALLFIKRYVSVYLHK
jgi:hypothetical protein